MQPLNPFIRAELRLRLPEPAERTRLRTSLQMTLRDVAASIGVTPQAVSFWEQGGTPSDPYLRAYVELLERVASMVGGHDRDQP